MLVRVYTCQNATLLEITCHGSNLFSNLGRSSGYSDNLCIFFLNRPSSFDRKICVCVCVCVCVSLYIRAKSFSNRNSSFF